MTIDQTALANVTTELEKMLIGHGALRHEASRVAGIVESFFFDEPDTAEYGKPKGTGRMSNPFKAYVEGAKKFMSGASHQEMLDRIVKNSMAIGAMDAEQKAKEERTKTTTVLKLPVESDLSQCAYENAINVIRDFVLEYSGYRQQLIPSFTLKVGIWDSDEALAIMAKYKNCDVEVKRNINVDCWQLESKYHNVTVNSEGA